VKQLIEVARLANGRVPSAVSFFVIEFKGHLDVAQLGRGQVEEGLTQRKGIQDRLVDCLAKQWYYLMKERPIEQKRKQRCTKKCKNT